MRLLIAGGGTGGHLFPGIALAREALARDPGSAVLFVGSKRGLESRLVPQAGFRLALVPASGVKGQGPAGALRALAVTPLGIVRALGILREFRPDVVVGVGGYASGPVMVAAAILGLPRAVIEPNAIPGITNRILARLVHEIYVAWDETVGAFPPGKAIATGTPMRRGVLEGPARRRAPGEPFAVLVFGGSQGAHRINEMTIAALGELGEDVKRMRFAHQTGTADLETVRAAYAARGIAADVAPFFDDMEARYAAADLAICRAGATTVSELAAAGKAAILIPFPFAADDHQTANARVLERAGGALLIPEKDLTPAGLAEAVRAIALTPGRAAEMGGRARAAGKRDAAAVILSRLEKLAGGAR